MAERTGQLEQAGLAAVLVRLSHLVQHLFSEVNKEFGLPPQQAQLLCHLVAGPVGMAELGRALHLGKSSVTGLVDRIERRGLAVRTPDPRDRRAFLITLTDAGARLAEDSHREVTARLEKLAGELPPDDYARLVSVIERLAAGN